MAAPPSAYNNKDLWKKYDYKTLGIIGESYFDIDFNEVFYLTDTGRMWDGWRYSVRDKLPQQEKWITEGLMFHSTSDIIKAIYDNRLPYKIMVTFHPQHLKEEWKKQRQKMLYARINVCRIEYKHILEKNFINLNNTCS